MKSDRAHLRSIVACPAALRYANEHSPVQIYLRRLPALLSLYLLCEQGQRIIQHKLICHWKANDHVNNTAAGYELILDWERRGILEKKIEGRKVWVTITLAGRTYLRTFEKALKKRPKAG